jgi:hypothetical protein
MSLKEESFVGRLRLVVVVLVPVALGAPAVFVFVPPLVAFAPAALACRAEFTAFVFGLTTVTAVPFYGFVKIMVGMSDPALAAVIVLGVKARDGGEKQRRAEERR